MKGILIADAGSTKTDWRLLLEGSKEHLEFKTLGINPLLNSPGEINSVLSELKNYLPDNIKITTIHFYGAGCSTSIQIELMTKLLADFWPDAQIFIYSDMLATGRALFGNKKGIACILGTGSNSCLMENGKIINQIPSLGFILGDEGSGAAMGKRLLNGIFKRALPYEIIVKFEAQYDLSLDELINKTYRGERPSAFIASFSKFIYENREHEAIQNLIREEFNNFFIRNIASYKDCRSLPLGFIGSIALNYKEILLETAKSLGFRINNIMHAPMEGLHAYHLEEIYR